VFHRELLDLHSSFICVDLSDFKNFFNGVDKTSYVFFVGRGKTKNEDLKALDEALIDLQRKGVYVSKSKKLWMHIRACKNVNFDLLNLYIDVVQERINKKSSLLCTVTMNEDKNTLIEVFIVASKAI